MAEPDRFVVERRRGSFFMRTLVVPVSTVVLASGCYFFLVVPGMDGLTRIGFVFVSGLLTLAFGGGFVWDLVHGNRPVLEVDRTGIRIMGAPRLDWSQVSEVRAEEEVSFSSAETESGSSLEIGGVELQIGKGGVTALDEALASGAATVSHRLGIVPRDPAIGGSGGPLGWISRAAESRRHQTAERLGRQAIDLAPIGIYERHMLAEFAEVVAGVRRFHPVVEVSDLKPQDRP
jgi:hypothetical protein